MHLLMLVSKPKDRRIIKVEIQSMFCLVTNCGRKEIGAAVCRQGRSKQEETQERYSVLRYTLQGSLNLRNDLPINSNLLYSVFLVYLVIPLKVKSRRIKVLRHVTSFSVSLQVSGFFKHLTKLQRQWSRRHTTCVNFTTTTPTAPHQRLDGVIAHR